MRTAHLTSSKGKSSEQLCLDNHLPYSSQESGLPNPSQQKWNLKSMNDMDVLAFVKNKFPAFDNRHVKMKLESSGYLVKKSNMYQVTSKGDGLFYIFHDESAGKHKRRIYATRKGQRALVALLAGHASSPTNGKTTTSTCPQVQTEA